jgi:transposase
VVKYEEVNQKSKGRHVMALHLRALTEEEVKTIKKWSQSRSEEARLVERARIISLASQGCLVPQIAEATGINEKTVRKWLKRWNEQGIEGLMDAPRSGAPSRDTPEVKAQIIAAALTNPRDVGCPFNCWTFERLAVYVREVLGFSIKKTRIFEILHEEGLRWRQQETWFGERVDPDFAKKRGPSNGSAKKLQLTVPS